MTGERGSSEICEESRGADSAPSQQRDLSETLPASRGEKRPLPTTAPPPNADFAAEKRARPAEAVVISEDSLPPTPEEDTLFEVWFPCRKSSEFGDWEEKVERVGDFAVGIPLSELMPRESGLSSEDGNDRGLGKGEGVNVKEEKEEDDAADVKEEHSENEEDTANGKEEHAANVKEEHGEFVRGGGIARVKEEPEEVGSNGGAVNVKVEHGGVNEGEAVNSAEEEQDEDLKEEAADVQQMPLLGYVRTVIWGVNHNSGAVHQEEVLSFVVRFGIDVYKQQVGCIEAPLGGYLTPLIRAGTIKIYAGVERWDNFKVFTKLWIRCHPQNSEEVLQALNLTSNEEGDGELFRTETFEGTVPSLGQIELLEDGGAWNGESFDSYEDLDRAVKYAQHLSRKRMQERFGLFRHR